MVTVTVAENLCDDNDVYVFGRRDQEDAGCHIGGISFACRPVALTYDKIGVDSAQSRQADTEVAQCVQNTVLPAMAKRVWVFLRTEWRPQSRVTSHLRLWGFLKVQCRLHLGGFELYPDVEFVRDGDVRYAGAMMQTSGRLQDVVGVLRSHCGFALLSDRQEIASSESIASLLESAYESTACVDWQTLAEKVCPLGDIVLRVPPITDIPPHEHESAIDLLMLARDLTRLRSVLA